MLFISWCKLTTYTEHNRPDKETKLMTYFDYDELVNLKDGDILFLDEMLNANPMILNAFLTVLEDRVLPSGTKLNDIMIVAAANPQGAVMLTPQIKERFIWYDVKFDSASWIKYMEHYQIPKNIIDNLCGLIAGEKFSNSHHNYITPRSVEKAIKLLIKNVHTPYEELLGAVLNIHIKNTTSEVLEIGDYIFGIGESLPWLDIKRKLTSFEIKNAKNTLDNKTIDNVLKGKKSSSRRKKAETVVIDDLLRDHSDDLTGCKDTTSSDESEEVEEFPF